MCTRKSENELKLFTFSKEDLNSVKVVSQLDRKYIVTKITPIIRNRPTEVLVLFDQHAVHERIRLEKLVKGSYLETSKGKREIKSVEVTPAIPLSFSESEIRIMKNYISHFTYIGVKLEFVNSTAVKVLSSPKCFAKRISTEKLAFREEISKQFLYMLLQEQVRHIMETGGSVTEMPKTIFNILCSTACHGAIKFGDELDIDVCIELLNKLKKCKAPFQCAHGRPVLYPLMDLESTKDIFKAANKHMISNLCHSDYREEHSNLQFFMGDHSVIKTDLYEPPSKYFRSEDQSEYFCG